MICDIPTLSGASYRVGKCAAVKEVLWGRLFCSTE